MFVPYEIPETDTFENRLKNLIHHNVIELVEKSKKEYQLLIDSGRPVTARDRDTKDLDLIEKIRIISQAVKPVPPPIIHKDNFSLPMDYYEEGLLGNLPTEGRILIEEYYKTLYLNDQDTEKYNFTYWERYYKVDKQTLRNIFNYVFFPIPNANDKSEVGKVLFFQDSEFAKRRKMLSDMTSDEYKEYLEKSDEKPELQEVKRLDYIEFQSTLNEPRVTERSYPIDEQELEKQLDNPLKYSAIIREIDTKINEIVSMKLEKSQEIDRDLQLKLEEYKTIQSKRIQEGENDKETQKNKLLQHETKEEKLEDDKRK